MIFFTDECFMYKANKLVEAFDRENEIRPLLDHFERGTPDITWIPAISVWNPKPVVICGDGRILKNKVERQVLKEAGLNFICLASGQISRGRRSLGRLSRSGPPSSSAEQRSDPRYLRSRPTRLKSKKAINCRSEPKLLRIRTLKDLANASLHPSRPKTSPAWLIQTTLSARHPRHHARAPEARGRFEAHYDVRRA